VRFALVSAQPCTPEEDACTLFKRHCSQHGAPPPTQDAVTTALVVEEHTGLVSLPAAASRKQVEEGMPRKGSGPALLTLTLSTLQVHVCVMLNEGEGRAGESAR
jgi:hypothetical protein